MALRIWKRITLLPGVRMNLSRHGASLSLGHRGFWYTLGSHGSRVTAGVPGTGVYWTQRTAAGRHVHGGHRFAFALVVLVLLALAFHALTLGIR